MKKVIVSILILSFFATDAKAQLPTESSFFPRVKNELHPGVKTIERTLHTSIRGLRRNQSTISTLDTLGRVVKTESFLRGTLQSRREFVYNDNNDLLFQIVTFNIRNPYQTNDTINTHIYQYENGRIIYQRRPSRLTPNVEVTRLIENRGDTAFVYQRRSYHFRPQTNVTDVFESILIMTYRDGRLIKFERICEDLPATIFLEYFSNGKLKRRTSDCLGIFTGFGHFTGISFSDDIFFEYRFDRAGRVRTVFLVIDGRRHRVATYRYRMR